MSIFKVLKFITDHPINRDHKFKAIFRFFIWQLRSRVASGPILFDWIHGSKFLVENGDTGLTGNIYTGLVEFPDMAFLLHYLRPQDTFVDVGANNGSYTILAGSVIGASGYAFEPVPHTFQKLTENIRLNKMEGRVKVLNLGLANREGILKFTANLDTLNHALLDCENDSNTIDVAIQALDQALAGARPNLLKIDVEGYESLVLEGASQTLRDPNLHCIIIEINGCGKRYGFDDVDLLNFLVEHDFQPFEYDPLSRDLKSLNGQHHQQGNTLFIRNEAFVRERISSAPQFDVLGVQL